MDLALKVFEAEDFPSSSEVQLFQTLDVSIGKLAELCSIAKAQPNIVDLRTWPRMTATSVTPKGRKPRSEESPLRGFQKVFSGKKQRCRKTPIIFCICQGVYAANVKGLFEGFSFPTKK